MSLVTIETLEPGIAKLEFQRPEALNALSMPLVSEIIDAAEELGRDRSVRVVILHGAGHRVTNALKGHGRSPNDLQGLVDLAGIVPTVCVVDGPPST